MAQTPQCIRLTLTVPKRHFQKEASVTIRRNTGNQQEKRLDQYGGKSEWLFPPEQDNGKQL